MKIIKLFMVAIVLAVGTQKSSAIYIYYNGTARLAPTATLGVYKLSCPSANTTCCAINWQTGSVLIYNCAIAASGPVSGDGTVTGTFDPNSVAENPDQETSVEMTVSALENCENCEQ